MVREESKAKIRLGKIQRKLLALLLAGVSLGMTRSPKVSQKILGELFGELKHGEIYRLKRSLELLHSKGLVKTKKFKGEAPGYTLTPSGKRVARVYSIEDLSIDPPKYWDRKWRIILFDVPEHKKKIRDALRDHLRRIGFLELQKSVFIFPFPCLKEIKTIVEYLEAKKYVRVIIADAIDKEWILKKHFGISAKK